MSNKIRIDSDLMRERAEEYRVQASNLEHILTKLDQLQRSLDNEWIGLASEAYGNKYAQLRPTFEKTSELTLDIATALDKVAQNMIEVDHKLARWF